MNKKKTIYLDNAASTSVNEKVIKEMNEATKLYGNPSSYNNCGREAREYVEKCRLRVARFLGARPDEIIFTASGTEANNLAIQGVARDLQSKIKPHIITTQIEHLSVLKPIKWLEKTGFDVTYLSVDKNGFINIEELQKAVKQETVFVSIMYANNEIGTIEPITKIRKLLSDFRNRKLQAHEKSLLFHVDACQATEYLNMNVDYLGVDLLTLNGSKIYGPKGIGVLYIRRGTRLLPIILGGEQERGLRAGTENLIAIGGLAVALDQISKKEAERLTVLRDYFIQKMKDLLPGIIMNGAQGDQRLPNNINVSIPGLTSEVLLLELDKYGVHAGSGSACTSHSVEPSHVLKAIGLDKKYLDGALRFSMGRHTTKKDMDYVFKVLPKIVKDLKKRYGNN